MIQKLLNISVQVHSKITLNGTVIIILTLLKNYYVSIETLLKNYYGSVQKHFWKIIMKAFKHFWKIIMEAFKNTSEKLFLSLTYFKSLLYLMYKVWRQTFGQNLTLVQGLALIKILYHHFRVNLTFLSSWNMLIIFLMSKEMCFVTIHQI